MVCKICLTESLLIFSKLLLGKYEVNYYQCPHCHFLQTEEPYWLDEAYLTGAISALDTGIMYRNNLLRNRIEKSLVKLFPEPYKLTGIDYGGGEGIFVRMMRDSGFNFFRQDLYADNLYARFFDIKDLPAETKFDILTTFEVFEHLPNPLEEIKKMFSFSDNIIFSTELQPNSKEKIKEWWYLIPETGQHISFYNEACLLEIARIFSAKFFTDGRSLHMLSKNSHLKDPFSVSKTKKRRSIVKRAINKFFIKCMKSKEFIHENPESLMKKDFHFVKGKLNGQ